MEFWAATSTASQPGREILKKALCIEAKLQDRTKGKSGNIGKHLLTSVGWIPIGLTQLKLIEYMLQQSQAPLELTIKIGNGEPKAKCLEQMYGFSPRRVGKQVPSRYYSASACLQLCEGN
jgi:hypothetical protein